MEEKKLKDEEIAKAILQSIEYSKTITYFDEWGNCKAIMMTDVIDLIHRLQERVFDYENLEKHAKKLEFENVEQKAEIERLTEENGYLKNCADNFLTDYQKAQKQVDELKEERENMQAEIIATEEARLRAVKDTAKEIWEHIVDCFLMRSENKYFFKEWLQDRYGVEVE